MKIQIISLNEHVDPLAVFFQSIPTEFLSLIRSKFTRYKEYGDVIPCKSLKTLNPKIWKYKGLIYKLRIDCGQQSARILFARSDHNLIILHGF
ncbi:TPA: type II toxin-antitoxin system RelE/ParE family toxin [Photobacterium damselae]